MSFESLKSGKRIVVIGGVGAGMSAASKARSLSSDIEILVFEKSGYISYGACGLPNLISDLIKSPGDLVSQDSKFFKEASIQPGIVQWRIIRSSKSKFIYPLEPQRSSKGKWQEKIW